MLHDASSTAVAPLFKPENQPLLTALATLLLDARRHRATDIHLEPASAPLRLRIDGMLRETPLPPNLSIEQILPLVKSLCSIKSADPLIPKDGHGILAHAGQRIEFTASIFPTLAGERLTLHLQPDSAASISMDQLRLAPAECVQLQQLGDVNRGIVILAGPASPGKTHLLYALLLGMDRDNRSFMTLEDPITSELPGICQTTVQPDLGLTWKRALIHMLRQDPDVLAVAPPAHHRSFPTLFSAAQDGRLIFMQLNTPSGAETLRHLLDAGLPAFQICDSLRTIVAHRSIRVLCPECKAAEQPNLSTFAPAVAGFMESLSHASFFRPVGCARCRHSGFESTIPLLEILPMTDALRDLVSAHATLADFRAASALSGIPPLLHNALLKASIGLVSLDEIRRILPPSSL